MYRILVAAPLHEMVCMELVAALQRGARDLFPLELVVFDIPVIEDQGQAIRYRAAVEHITSLGWDVVMGLLVPQRRLKVAYSFLGALDAWWWMADDPHCFEDNVAFLPAPHEAKVLTPSKRTLGSWEAVCKVAWYFPPWAQPLGPRLVEPEWGRAKRALWFGNLGHRPNLKRWLEPLQRDGLVTVYDWKSPIVGQELADEVSRHSLVLEHRRNWRQGYLSPRVYVAAALGRPVALLSSEEMELPAFVVRVSTGEQLSELLEDETLLEELGGEAKLWWRNHGTAKQRILDLLDLNSLSLPSSAGEPSSSREEAKIRAALNSCGLCDNSEAPSGGA